MSVTVNDSPKNQISVSLSDGTKTTISTKSSSISVTSPDVNRVDVKASGPKGDKGETGPQGPIGPQGPAGEDGAGGLVEVVDDTTPQLGGNLDVQAFNLYTSATDQDIMFTPSGTGSINLDGTVKFKRVTSAPAAFEGGMYADNNDNLYFGVS